MRTPHVLHLISPLPHVSAFDANLAVDAGFDHVFTYPNVQVNQVQDLVRDAIFSRNPKRGRFTGVFIGGNDALQAFDMLEAAKRAIVPPFGLSLFVDPGRGFTAAAAIVAYAERTLLARFGVGLDGRRVVVFGGTRVVGFSAGVIAAGRGARVLLVGQDGPARANTLAAEAARRFGVTLEATAGTTDRLNDQALVGAEIVIGAAGFGVRVLKTRQLAPLPSLQLVIDLNAVPPAGIEGVGGSDDGARLAGTRALSIGPLTIGRIKYQVQRGLFRQMIGEDEPVTYSLRECYRLADRLVSQHALGSASPASPERAGAPGELTRAA